MSKPDLEKMQELHNAVADALLNALDSDDRMRAIEQAIKFLNNNGVNVDIGATTAGQNIAAKLPFIAPEEEAA